MAHAGAFRILGLLLSIMALGPLIPAHAGGPTEGLIVCSQRPGEAVDADTEQAIKDAVWAYTEHERQAYLDMDSSLLGPVATTNWISVIESRISDYKRQG